jgi:small subunit ribosomal protein S20
MANIRSAVKRIGQAAQRQKRNRGVRSRLRSTIKDYRSGGDQEKSKKLSTAVSEIDRARKKGVIHRNAAARYKSRLAKKANAKS